jgi:hypothetical protein
VKVGLIYTENIAESRSVAEKGGTDFLEIFLGICWEGIAQFIFARDEKVTIEYGTFIFI